MLNLKDYIGKEYNIICDNKEEWDAIIVLASKIDYAGPSPKYNYVPNKYLTTSYKNCLTSGTLPCGIPNRIEIKASEFLSSKDSPNYEPNTYLVALKDRACYISKFKKGDIGVTYGTSEISLKDGIGYMVLKKNETGGHVKSFSTFKEAEEFSKTLLGEINLLEEAKQRYPIGSSFIDLVNDYVFTVASHNFDNFGDKTQIYIPVTGNPLGNKTARIYKNGVWAKISSNETVSEYQCLSFPKGKGYIKLEVVEDIPENIGEFKNPAIPKGTKTWMLSEYENCPHWHIEDNRYITNFPKRYFKKIISTDTFQETINSLPLEYIVKCDSKEHVNNVMEKMYGKPNYVDNKYDYVIISEKFTGSHLRETLGDTKLPIIKYADWEKQFNPLKEEIPLIKDEWIGKTVKITQHYKSNDEFGKIGKVLSRNNGMYYDIENVKEMYKPSQFEEVLPTTSAYFSNVNTAVQCKTQEEYDFVINTLSYNLSSPNWTTYKDKTCVNLQSRGFGTADGAYNGWKIYQFEEWCKLKGYTIQIKPNVIDSKQLQLVHCKTQEQWDIVTLKLKYVWIESSRWGIYKENTCIKLSSTEFGNRDFYESNYPGCNIISFEEWYSKETYTYKHQYLEWVSNLGKDKRGIMVDHNRFIQGKIFNTLTDPCPFGFFGMDWERFLKSYGFNFLKATERQYLRTTEKMFSYSKLPEFSIREMSSQEYVQYLEEQEIPRPSRTQTVFPIKVPLFLEEE